jgi:hypothetical protein
MDQPPPRRRLLQRAGAALLAAALLLPAAAARADIPPGLAHRILVVGDSQAQGLAGALMRRYRRDREIRVIDRSKISTGLMPRANYDWPAEIKGVAAADHADVAVVMFGANDRPPVRRHGGVDAGLVATFRETYGAKVTAIVDALREAHMPVVWVGHPIVRDPDFSDDMALLDSIYDRAATAAGATYLSTWDMFAAADGSYTAFGPGLDGVTTRLRADDGVHLTAAGYDVLARALEPHLLTEPPASAQAHPN